MVENTEKLNEHDKLVIELREWRIKYWNAAIDKCIEVANKYDSYGPAYEMRTLKK